MPNGVVTLGNGGLISRTKIKEWKLKLNKFNLELTEMAASSFPTAADAER